MTIRQATPDDLEALAPLFDSYRQFYGQPADLSIASSFLRERLVRSQSVIFLALDDALGVVGFTQLFPSFSSLSAAPIYILSDLFVAPQARRSGCGAALLRAAAQFGRATNAVYLELTTAITNKPAQALYEAEGWKRDEIFLTYTLNLASTEKSGRGRA